MNNRIIQIFDTTLRDGEQTPGVCLTVEEKVEIAHALAKLKVDVIEAGFPVISPGDFAAVQQIAAKVEGPIIAGLARCNAQDIEAAGKALAAAKRKRIHTFIATSDIHLEHKLKMSRLEVLTRTEEAVRYARKFTDDVEFSAEDASRTERDFLCKVFTTAIAAGATVINIPDTVGYTMPDEFAALIRYIQENVPNIHKATISVHCHNDLGMAVANSLAAIRNGATQIECTVNGIGERAGNASLEELVMALCTRSDFYHATTNIQTTNIYRTSRLVSALTGIDITPTKAIVGENAFAHESGIHQHGVLNNASTYEIMSPEAIGISRNSLVLGKHSGRHALEERLQQLGYELDSKTIDSLFAKFKQLAEHKKSIYDQDLEALIADKQPQPAGIFNLAYHHVVSSNQHLATATIHMTTSDRRLEAVATAAGPIDAAFKAIEKALGFEVCLKDFQLKSVTSGEDALGDATVWVEQDGRVFIGRGLSTDIIEASAKAYVNAINKMVSACGYPAVRQAIGGN